MNNVAIADARRLPLASQSVHCIVTSPPFWGLRKYPVANSIGHEPTFAEHLDNILSVFRELRRVLRDDGTVWMEHGDSWAGSHAPGAPTPNWQGGGGRDSQGSRFGVAGGQSRLVPTGNLQLLPFRVVMALQDDGWYLRSVCIWHRPNCMPESVRNRPVIAHSYVFLLTKRASGYFYDLEAERLPVSPNWRPMKTTMPAKQGAAQHEQGVAQKEVQYERACGPALRSVWTIPTQPLSLPHYAAFPEELARRCISLGTSARGVCPKCGAQYIRVVDKWSENPGNRTTNGPKSVKFTQRLEARSRTLGWTPTCGCDSGQPVPAVVLDPFVGSGTTVAVARSMGRVGVGFDIAEEYCAIAKIRRCRMVTVQSNHSPQLSLEEIW